MYDVEQTANTRSTYTGLFVAFSIAVLVCASVFTATIVFQFQKDGKLDNLERVIENFNTSLQVYQLKSQKGQPNGYVPINSSGLIPEEYIFQHSETTINYRGCWNASSNTPTITSGIGTDGDLYTVCEEGTTSIDGETEWYVQDQLLFVIDILSWVRLDGGPISVLQPGTGVKLFDVAEGTPLVMKKFLATGDIVATKDSNGVVTLSLNNATIPNTTVAVVNIGGGLELTSPEGSPNTYNVETMTGVFPLNVQRVGDTVVITIDAPYTPLDYESGNDTMVVGGIGIPVPVGFTPTDPTPIMVFGTTDMFWYFIADGPSSSSSTAVGTNSISYDPLTIGLFNVSVDNFASGGVGGGYGYSSTVNGDYMGGYGTYVNVGPGTGNYFQATYYRMNASLPATTPFGYTIFGTYVNLDVYS